MKILTMLKSIFTRNSKQTVNVDMKTTSYKEKSIQLPTLDITRSQEIIEPLLTVSQAAKRNKVTRQAVFFAIKMKKLNARKEGNTWLIEEKDLQEYLKYKYCRSKSHVDGELIFDKKKGYYSIADTAQFLDKSMNHVYYLVRVGKIQTHRQGGTIVVQDKELYRYAEYVAQKGKKRLKVG